MTQKSTFTCAWRCRKVAHTDISYGQTFLEKFLQIYLSEFYFKLEKKSEGWYSHCPGTVCVLSTCHGSAGKKRRSRWSVMESAVCCTLKAPVSLLRTAVRTSVRLKLAGREGLSWHQAANYWTNTRHVLCACLLPRVHLQRCSSVALGSLLKNPPSLILHMFKHERMEMSKSWCGLYGLQYFFIV